MNFSDWSHKRNTDAAQHNMCLEQHERTFSGRNTLPADGLGASFNMANHISSSHPLQKLPNRPGKYPKSLLWKKASCHEGVESQRAIIQHHEYNYVELQITAQQICKISKENYGLKLDFALSAFHHVCPCMNNDRINCMFKCLKRPSVCWHLPDVRTYCGRENNDSTLSGKSRSYNCAYFDSAEQFLSCLLPIDNFSFFKSWFFPNFSSFNCLNLTRPSQ